jgi:prephenate dehydrogenase
MLEPANPGSDLSTCRIAIAGLGLMGGSLALALRGRCQRLLGIDPDPATRDLALKWGIVDAASADPRDILPVTDLLVLAAPVQAILDWIEKLPGLATGALMVLDLGSTKVQITEAFQTLPERFDSLGGHPMCGKEKSTLAHAEVALYQGCVFAFTPLQKTSWRLRRLAEDIARAIGAMPMWMDPATHDRWVAATSHLPYLTANALAYVTPQEACPLVGPGFRSTSRLASSSLPMMMGILASNRENILDYLTLFSAHLEVLRVCLERQDWAALNSYLAIGSERQAALLNPEKGS